MKLTCLTQFTDFFQDCQRHCPVKKYLDVTSTRPVNWTRLDDIFCLLQYCLHIRDVTSNTRYNVVFAYSHYLFIVLFYSNIKVIMHTNDWKVLVYFK